MIQIQVIISAKEQTQTHLISIHKQQNKSTTR